MKEIKLVQRNRHLFYVLALLCLHLSLIQAGAEVVQHAPVTQHTPDAQLVGARWPAFWIASPSAQANAPGVFYFRKHLVLTAIPQHFWVNVSADNRFVLHVNGAYAGEGPARGDLLHWRFEMIDLAPLLHPGKNVIAAVVWNFGEMSPVAQVSSRTGFLMQGNTKAEAGVNTGSAWQVREEMGRAPIVNTGASGYYAAGPAERVDGRVLDRTWDKPQTDRQGWTPPELLGNAASREARDSRTSWELVPDPLPPMKHELVAAGDPVRVEGLTSLPAFPEQPLTIKPHSHVTILLDHRTLQTAYPELSVSGGRNAVLKVTYAEALYDASGNKGNRNDIAGRHIEGITDEFIAGGQQHEAFYPLWWRTWRYLQIDITTEDDPLQLDSLHAWFTAFPFQARATISGDIPRLKDIWDTGWRTAQMDAHETYMDTPYWEQLQYVGDTRIQALISYVVTGDPRLARQAIEAIDDSRIPEGITQSRYPSSLAQFIPPFSLYWVNMLHDYWMYVDDPEFVRGVVPHTRPVLDWFAGHLRPDGLLGKMGWWEFADWTANYHFGAPPEDADGGSSFLALQFIAALHDAADMESQFGSPDRAAAYRAIIQRATEALNRESWDPVHGLYADTPSKTSWSGEANVLAVMLGVAPVDERAAILRRVMAAQPDRTSEVGGVSVPALSPLSYYFRFYLSRALVKAGMGDDYVSQLGPWYGMLDLGLSTWAETPEPTRSDSHAWSASPNFDLLTVVAGIKPASPGFARVLIAPHLKGLHDLSATMPHSKGMISAQYHHDGTKWIASIRLPKGLSGSLEFEKKTLPLHPGLQVLTFPSR